MATKGIEGWLLSTTLQLIDATLREDPNEYAHKPYIAEN